MMKKNGFTLAEVLITLSIIGVVATMTLPALMTNTQEQQAKTGLKKAINVLTEASQMNLAIDGFDFGTTKAAANTDGITADLSLDTMTFDSIIGNRLKVDYKKGTAVPKDVTEDLKDYKAVYFTDGTALYYNPTDVQITNDNGAEEADKLPFGYVVYYDINGSAAPNIVSNCGAETLGKLEVAADFDTLVGAGDATKACKTAGNKVLKDIFAIRLRGSVAQPEGEAAVWAYNGDVKSEDVKVEGAEGEGEG